MSQISNGLTWSDDQNDANSLVNATRLTAMIGQAALLNQAVTAQTDKAITAEADRVLIGDSTVTDPAGYPKSATLLNLLPESVRNLSKIYATSANVTHTVINGGTVDLYAVTLSPAATTLMGGMTLRFRAPAANTLPVQVSVNLATTGGAGTSGTQVPVKSLAGADLVAGNIVSGQIVEIVYDAVTNVFIAFNLVGGGAIAPSQLTESLRMSANQFSTDTSSVANQFVVTLSPQLTAISAGMVIRWKAAHANTGACTVQMNTTPTATTKSLLKNGGVPLVSGDIANNQLCEAVFDGTAFYLLNPLTTLFAAYYRAGNFTTTNTANATVTFSSAVADANYSVIISPTATVSAPCFASNKTSAGFTAAAGSGVAGSHTWDYIIIPYL